MFLLKLSSSYTNTSSFKIEFYFLFFKSKSNPAINRITPTTIAAYNGEPTLPAIKIDVGPSAPPIIATLDAAILVT